MALPQFFGSLALLLTFAEGARVIRQRTPGASEVDDIGPESGGVGTYAGEVECRYSLATTYPTSLWRYKTSPGYQMGYELNISTPGWACATPHKINVYYPIGVSGKAPLISYGHGRGVGGTALDSFNRGRWFQPLVEQGFVVVAYQHGDTWEYCSSKENVLGQIDWLRTSSYASMIDFNNIGTFGYSAGGPAVLGATRDDPGIKASVTLMAHCPFGCSTPAVPTLWFTGNSDTISTQGPQRAVFNRMSELGLFVSQNVGHTFGDAHASEAVLPMTIAMFRCYLMDEQSSCSEINQRSALEDNCFGTVEWINQAGQAPGPAPGPAPGLACSQCEAQGYLSDACGCGVCGSYGGCSWSCTPSTSRPQCDP